MRKNARALAATVMTLGAIATAYAAPPMSYGYGEAESFSSNPMPSEPSMTTRAEVKADLKDARASGTLPRGEADMAAPKTMGSTLTRSEVRQQALESTRADFHAHVSYPSD